MCAANETPAEEMKVYFLAGQYYVRVNKGPYPLEGPYNSLIEVQAAHPEIKKENL